MTCAPEFAITRRAGLAGLLAALAAPAAFAAGKPSSKPKVITMLGDSVTAGYGLAAADALPAQLQLALARLGVKAEVRAAGVSGDTMTDALGRVDFSVQADTSLCLVELGGNDLLQGIDPRTTATSLNSILDRLKARHIPAMVVGMLAPPMAGAAYMHEFNALFADAAKAHHAAFYPFLLYGVVGNRSLNQKDNIHPNPAGVKIVAAHMAPAVAKALAATR